MTSARLARIITLGALAALAALAALSPGPSPATGEGVRLTLVSAGGAHTCALTEAGGVWCWGANLSGQVGDGSTVERRYAPVEVRVAAGGTPLRDVTRISAGGAYTCALTSLGGVQCWGGNRFGELGDGSFASRRSPADVLGLQSGVVEIAAGGLHACALTTAGRVKCWGRNESGQLGDGTTGDGDPLTQDNNSPTPLDVCEQYDEEVGQCTEVLSGVVAVAAGGNHTCALLPAGRVKCWGWNGSGNLGNGTRTGAAAPTYVCEEYDDIFGRCSQVVSDIAAISAGSSHTCGITVAGGAKCWGANFDGELGDGTIVPRRTTPVDVCQVYDDVAERCVEVLASAAVISAGLAHTCAVAASGSARCWGDNLTSYQLGDGRACGLACPTPVDVHGLSSGVTAISAGHRHTCALTTDGAQCWGGNFWGQLGSGICCNDSRIPVDVAAVGPKATPTPTVTATATGPATTATQTPTQDGQPEPVEGAATATPTSTRFAASLPATGGGGPSGGGGHRHMPYLVPALGLAALAAAAAAWRRVREEARHHRKL